jgi:hypothetical protein
MMRREGFRPLDYNPSRRSGLYDLPLGHYAVKEPEKGETFEHALKRLKRLARSYRPLGKSFHVSIYGDNKILWLRTNHGDSGKLALWYRLEVGDTYVLTLKSTPEALEAAKRTASYLKRTGKGTFDISVVDGALNITRLTPADQSEANE